MMELAPTNDTRSAFRRLVGCAAVLALAGFCSADVWAAEPVSDELGTLFYTPTQRADIVRARSPQSDTTAQGASSVQRLTGVVRRGNGKGTVWINGKVVPEDAARAPQIKGVDAVVDGKRLRVGEGIDTLSGKRSDVVAPGAVTVRTPK